uniref:Uncharacterized protein n=1 Tax=uncultured Desulfobacterales bacterium HF0200_07G10 TaxID=710741 RepID=E0XU32_9BACT|nr:hypothetical protein [uncultured Desulfobacterales bacterium HF0200_07G10]
MALGLFNTDKPSLLMRLVIFFLAIFILRSSLSRGFYSRPQASCLFKEA